MSRAAYPEIARKLVGRKIRAVGRIGAATLILYLNDDTVIHVSTSVDGPLKFDLRKL